MTPAINLLKRKQIQFKLHTYKINPSSRSYGEDAALALGVDRSRLFKTLVVRSDLPDEKTFVALVPVSAQLDLKQLARVIRSKKTRMARPDEVGRKTGYIPGGVSPFAQKNTHETIVHQTLTDFETIFVSAGKRGLQIEIKPQDLISLTHARPADIAK